jgi:hypothetical protein
VPFPSRNRYDRVRDERLIPMTFLAEIVRKPTPKSVRFWLPLRRLSYINLRIRSGASGASSVADTTVFGQVEAVVTGTTILDNMGGH